MRQAGVLAAAGVYALDNMVDRLATDHDNARRLADGLREQGWAIDRERVETNIFFVETPGSVDIANMADRLAKQAVLVTPPRSGRTMRLATHYGIEDSDITRALDAFANIKS